MFRFVYGVDYVPSSGILGAVDAQWNAAAGRMNDAVYAVILKKYSEIIHCLKEDQIPNLEELILN